MRVRTAPRGRAPPELPDGAGLPPTAWHAQTVAAVAHLLATGPEGLSPQESARRRREHGPNLLEETPPPSWSATLAHQFTSPLIAILVVAAVVTLVLGEYMDATVIAAVLVLNAVIGFVQEWRAQWSVRALLALMAPRARVVRDGAQQEVAGADLVPGDLVLLESGSLVPADLRLATATALRVDESLLTGESLPADKHVRPLDDYVITADRANMAYTGTVVASGRARGYVTATGGETELGEIAGRMRAAPEPQTPLMRRMARLAHIITVAAIGSALVAFTLGVVTGRTPAEMFLVAVAMAVSAVPEGLPVALTVALALGVRRMSRRNAIVRSLPAVETLGSTTVIGSDKTGTLTENRMTTRSVWADGRLWDLAAAGGGVRWPEAARADHPLHLVLVAGVLASEAQVYLDDGVQRAEGDPTEVALLLSAMTAGIDPEPLRMRYQVVDELPFEPERRYAASLRRRDRDRFLFVKGAPERVLQMSATMLTGDGPAPLDASVVHAAADALAREGLRVLAMAYRPLGESPHDLSADPRDLVFLGLQGMWDPPRAGVREAVAGCREAGIRVVMITGDHATTGRAIAHTLGIADRHEDVLTGSDVERLTPHELGRRSGETAVFARVSPEHKLRIVEALRARGEVVAVTGDGVNDAPALKAADIGIAMGRNGTDVAREAADMVLADDDFVSIYAAVEEGRATFDNVRKVTFFLLSCGLAEIIAILAALVLDWPLLLLPAQILWLNLVTNGLQDVALAFEPPEPGILDQPPRARGEGVLSRLLWERTLVIGVVMAIATLVMYRWALDTSGSVRTAQTVALTTLVLAQAFQLANSRSERLSAFRVRLLSNPFLLVAQAGALVVHAAALHLGPTQLMLRVEPIGAGAWLRALGVASCVLVAGEIHKRVRRAGPAPGVQAGAGMRPAT
jgi:calcium-translocating P-type ATPase